MDIYKILEKINISCIDNGKKFNDRNKIEQIIELLKDSCFNKIYDGNISIIFANKSIKELKTNKTILVSSHIDTAYENFFQQETEAEIIGTLDNSITNAILIEQAHKIEKIGNFIFSFHGNEEDESNGAAETIQFLRNEGINPEFVISLDTTSIGFKNYYYKIENYFIEKTTDSLFKKKKEFKIF